MDSGRRCVLLLSILCCCGQASYAEVFDIFDFDESEEGAWSDIDLTTLTVPLVADGSIQLDGSSSSAEYGSFEGRTVSPGSPDGSVGNAWILGYAINKDWQGADDSEFTFYLAHDTDPTTWPWSRTTMEAYVQQLLALQPRFVSQLGSSYGFVDSV